MLAGSLSKAAYMSRPTTIGFLLIDAFSMLSVVSAIEPLRAANRALDREAYAWCLVSVGGGAVLASNGIEVAVSASLSDLAQRSDRPDVLFVCAGLDHDPQPRAKLHAGLVALARTEMVIGSLSAGTFILARAGLLDGYRCTVHWEFQPAFEEAFPHIECSSGLFVMDRDRWTGSGGITGLDMMLGMIERDHGDALARTLGNVFQVDRIRNAASHQRPGQLERLETLPEPLQRIVELMMGHIEEPLRMEEIAEAAEVNLRRMERMFQAHLEQSPAQFYRGLRLERARELLMHTNLSTLEVGMLTGFSSSSHFAMAYQKHLGHRPSEARRRAGRASPQRMPGATNEGEDDP